MSISVNGNEFYYVRSKKLKDIARHQPCVMCGADDGTIVLAHANLLEFGKGKGIKASDIMGGWLCWNCHSEYDQGNKMTKEEKRDFILTAICRTINELARQGVIKIG